MQAVLVLLVVLPFWASFLIRIYAWMNILQHDGLLNQVLLALHIVREPPAWLSTDTAVYIGVVYSYLPFMVLPLYATFEKLRRAASLRLRPISAARAGRRFGSSLCCCRRQASLPARCCVSFRSSANSSSPICSAARIPR